MSALVEINGLKRSFGDIDALSVDEMSIEKGKIVAVVGANGSGKSTWVEVQRLLVPMFRFHYIQKDCLQDSIPTIRWMKMNGFLFREKNG